MNLYPHQKELIDAAPDRHLLAWGTGTGKTLTALKIAEKKGTLLILCPKSLKDNWKREIGLWTGLMPGQYLILSKEEFKKWIKNQQHSKFDTVIVDEAHYFFGIKSQLFKALKAYLKAYKIDNRLLLTATPYMSTPWNVWCAAALIGWDINYRVFDQAYFYKVRMGRRMVPVMRAEAKAGVVDIIKKIGTTKALDECIAVPAQIFEREDFSVTTDQKKALSALADPQHIVRWTKAHQILGGSLKGDGFTEDAYFPSEKAVRLLELIGENPLIAVVCRYNNEIASLKAAVEKTYPKKQVFVINGAEKDKQAIVDKINKLDDAVVFINAACSEGYGLPNIPIMIFYSYDFSLKNYIQMLGRIQRINNIKRNVYISLVVKGTIDEDVYTKVVVEKQDFQVAIYKN